MSSKITTLILCFCLAGSTVFAQEIWSLEKCIEHAQTNSLTIKRSQLNVSNAELTEKGSKLERLPSLNASTSAGYNFGRTIDPSTNVFRNREIGSNNISINAGIILFDGFRINNNVKQAKLDLAAGKADLEDTNLKIAVSVAGAYLNILFAEDQLANANNQLKQSQDQLQQTNKLILAGTLPENDRLQLEAQIATNEQAVILQENSLEIAYLNLKNLMQLSPDFDLQIERPEVMVPDVSPEEFTFQELYQQSLQTQPVIKANDLRMQSAVIDEKIARTGMIPRLTAFGNLRSDAATRVSDFNNPNLDNTYLELGQELPYQANGVDILLAQYELKGVSFPNRSYIDQIRDNFGQSFGVTLSVPIYNNSVNKIAVERARLNVISTEIANEEVKQQLRADVMRSIADAKAAKKQLVATEKSLAALEANFVNNEKRYNLGAINTFEFTSSKNQLDQARVDYTIAKYDYIYKLVIVDYYRGKKITFK